MICRFYGISVPSTVSTTQSGASPLGVSVRQLANLFTEAKFQTSAEKVGWEELTRKKTPFVVHARSGHFLVVTKISARKVQIADPAYDVASISHKDFKWRWFGKEDFDSSDRGWCIEVLPPEKFEENSDETLGSPVPSLLAFLLPTARPYFSDFAKLLFIIGITALLAVAIPVVTQILVDVAMPAEDISLVVVLLLAQFAVTLGRIVSNSIKAWFTVQIGMLSGLHLRMKFIDKLMRLPLYYYEDRAPGIALQRFRDYAQLEVFLSQDVIRVVAAASLILAYGVVILVYSLPSFVVLTIGVGMAVVWNALFLAKLRQVSYKLFLMTAQSDNVLLQILRGILDIKLAVKEHSHRDKWRDVHSQIISQNFRKVGFQQAQDIGVLAISELRNITIIGLCAYSVINGQLTIGMMLAILFLLGQVHGPLTDLISFVTQKRQAHWAAERAEFILSHEDEHPGGQKQIEPEEFFEKPFKFDGVSYYYRGAETPAINKLDVVFPPGKITALIGASGSGKTTVLKLLSGLHQPTTGQVLFGGHPINHLHRNAFRSHCSGMFSDSFIFADTLVNNVTLWEERFSEESLLEALNSSGCSEFVRELPMGIRTRIGAGGCGLSSGQTQRLLLARVLYQSPCVIFLDEPTSSLDSKNESRFLESLQRIREGRTIVMAAHRLSTVLFADNAILLSNGRKVSEGCPTEVVEAYRSGV